jgi:hypothetical protein
MIMKLDRRQCETAVFDNFGRATLRYSLYKNGIRHKANGQRIQVTKLGSREVGMQLGWDREARKSATTSRAGGYEDGPWKGPRPSLLVAADLYVIDGDSIL